jgi:glycosyltransferase involved in cell wall biosynthesis
MIDSRQYEVSVVMTTYNMLELFKRALQYMLAQRFDHPWQIVIADDESTDGTVEYLKRIKKHPGPDIEVIYNKHVGVARNYASALDACLGKYICFCDNDDYWFNLDKLSMQYYYMEGYGYVFCMTHRLNTDASGKITDGPPAPKDLSYDGYLRNGFVSTGTVMMRSDLYFKYADLNKYIRLKMQVWDYAIFMEILRHSPKGAYYLPVATSVFSMFPESASRTHGRRKRLHIIAGQAWVKFYFIFRYGCKPYTFVYVIYKTIRDIYSLIFKRWYK